MFYRMDSNHILNKKVRLLVNEFDSDGYYIWSCILDYGYSKYGYFFDLNDKDELELFASEYCKKKLSLVKEVITGCIRRGLFDENVANLFGVLTSSMMQEVFLYATSERRRKGSQFTMCNDYLLLSFGDEIPVNIAICPGTKANKSRDNSADIDKDRNKDKVSKRSNSAKKLSGDKPPGGMPPVALGKRVIRKQPPVDYWQSLVSVWFSFYGEKFKDEENHPAQPFFEGKEANFLRRIVLKLKSLSERKKKDWSEKYAAHVLQSFLQKAYEHDEWLRRNFELSNLESKFNSIINANNQPAPKQTNGSNHGKSAGAIKLAETLRNNLGISHT